MNIILGENLSHNAYTEHYFSATINKQTLSPLGFISLLELKLGLLCPDHPEFIRLQSWLKLVDQYKQGKFFEKSFDVDPIGTARHLLSLRDELMLSGWDGTLGAETNRISDLSMVNQGFNNKHGTPDRIQLIIEKLKGINQAFEANIEFLNEVEFNKSLWENLFSALEEAGAKIRPYQNKFIESKKSDLQSLKKSLSSSNKNLPKEDGSVSIFVSDNVRESAEQLARYLSTKNQKDFDDIVLIAHERYRPLIANAFSKFDIPFSGDASNKSISRPSIQVLLLALGLIWSPKDPHSALALLLHPLNPIPKWISKKLVYALDQLPAVGGESWKEAIEEITDYLQKSSKKNDDGANQLKLIDDWFSLHLNKIEDSIEKTHLIAICDMVEEWSRKKSPSKDSLLQVSFLCRNLKAFLNNWHLDTVDKHVFRKILRETLSQGCVYQDVAPSALGPIIVNSPSEILFEASEIIWWDANFSSVQSSIKTDWSRKERQVLAELGITIPDPQYCSELNALKWQNPIGYAKDKLLFFTFSKTDSGEKDYMHPVLNQALNPNEMDLWLSAISINPGQTNNSLTKSYMKALNMKLVKNNSELEFPPIIDWKLPKNKLTLRNSESPSSLEVLMGCPLSYLLKYHSSLKSAYIPNVQDLLRLIGTLNHRVLEHVFPKGKPPTPAKAKKMVQKNLEKFVPEMLPELLLPKNLLVYKNVQSKLENAAVTYSNFLQANDLEVLGTEETKEKKILKDLTLSGQVDQLLSKNGKPVSVIDFKTRLWKVMKDKIKDGTSMQLSIYSWLHKSSTWPDIGYFGIEKSELFVAGKYTKEAESPKEPISPKEVIDRLIEMIEERKAELNSGKIQARGHLEEDEQGEYKALCKFCDYDGICGMRWQS